MSGDYCQQSVLSAGMLAEPIRFKRLHDQDLHAVISEATRLLGYAELCPKQELVVKRFLQGKDVCKSFQQAKSLCHCHVTFRNN